MSNAQEPACLDPRDRGKRYAVQYDPNDSHGPRTGLWEKDDDGQYRPLLTGYHNLGAEGEARVRRLVDAANRTDAAKESAGTTWHDRPPLL